jgi:hypothetical protein
MKTLVLDTISIDSDGLVNVSVKQVSSDGDLIGRAGFSVAPGADVQESAAAFNARMAENGFAPVQKDDASRIANHAAAAWTPDVLSAYAARTGAAK